MLLLFKVEMQHAQIDSTLPRPESVHSGSASYDDCDVVFPAELRVSSWSKVNRNTNSESDSLACNLMTGLSQSSDLTMHDPSGWPACSSSWQHHINTKDWTTDAPTRLFLVRRIFEEVQ